MFSLNESKKIHSQELLQSAVCSLSLFVFFVAYRALSIQFVFDCSFVDALDRVLHRTQLLFIIVLICIIAMPILYLAFCQKRRVANFCYKWRYLIAAVAVMVLTILQVSGSSLAMWSKTLPSGSPEGLLLGSPRWFRTDEYATSLAETFAQFSDQAGFLPYFGTVFRATNTDMLISGIPVLDFSAICDPLSWGYIFLGLNMGLAFYWNARAIFLFLLTFDTGMLLTKGSRGISLCLALLITFGPAACWWGSGEIILYSEALLISGAHYFNKDTAFKKIIAGFVFSIMLGSLILTLYPAWIVPYAVLFLFIGIGYLIDNHLINRNNIALNICCLIPGLIFLFTVLLHVVNMSSESISLLMGTSYPGARESFGIGDPSALFRSITYLFTPVTINGLSTDRPDAFSAFFDLYPLGCLLALYVLLIKKKRDPILISLIAIMGFYSVYYFIGLPDIVAKVTLMSFTIPERMAVVITFVDVMLLVKSISMLSSDAPQPKEAGLFSFVFTAMIIGISVYIEPSFFSIWMIIAGCIICFIFVYAFIRCNVSWMCIASFIVALFGGALVNPVQIGTGPISDNELICDIKSIASQGDTTWISQTGWAENIPTFGGAPTISSTHYYPDFELWQTLDPDGSEIDIYNRFAHVWFSVSDGVEPNIRLNGNDVIGVEVPISYLQKLKVTHVLAQENLEFYNANSYGVRFKLVKSYPGFYIYELSYDF